MNRTPKNTAADQRAKAWKRGYETGRAGNEGATAPFLESGFTEPLARSWREGWTRGLEEWRAEELAGKRMSGRGGERAKGRAV
jgi:hypothetical protein